MAATPQVFQGLRELKNTKFGRPFLGVRRLLYVLPGGSLIFALLPLGYMGPLL